ncbi:MAG: family 16 glycosylhydrolase [Rhizomicrobium sp.]
MNLSKPLRSASRYLHILFSQFRSCLPRQRSITFSGTSDGQRAGVGPIIVINLDRQKGRWLDILRELDGITDAIRKPLSERVVRSSACDAQLDLSEFHANAEVGSVYTLADQLFVEPQPHAAPDTFDLTRPIKMSQAEIAVACSHIAIWRAIAKSNATYTLVLEDDVWFERGFGRVLDQAWREMEVADVGSPKFDILYVSYEEVRHGAPKELLSRTVFRPERGLWFLSGYVLSRNGAQKLLELLPSRGPIDLWINHKFHELEVRALRRSVVNQRRDLHSTNSYSILPALSRIGVLDNGDAALFHRRPTHTPVFVFGPPNSGLSSLAMALSMLGYRCCSDFDRIPKNEWDSLLAGRSNRVFNAYVNVGSLRSQIPLLIQRYPNAKYVLIDDAGCVDQDDCSALLTLEGADVLHLLRAQVGLWRPLCEHLKVAPPVAQYPIIRDLGQRRHQLAPSSERLAPARWLRHDSSPWIAKSRAGWTGIRESAFDGQEVSSSSREEFEDDFAEVRSSRWLLRNDTFSGNLGLFRPANVTPAPNGGLSLAVMQESLGVRNFSAAAITSRDSFLFGRFEITLRATNVPGLVTGFFLHRDSPRQEIDIEILGNQPDRLLVNVFYNPGTDGARFDYGYRGTPATIKLGFDASKALHKFAIEWSPCEIRWFVDGKPVHCRPTWGPTPIPHLPMALHVNTWPSRSRRLAGRLAIGALPDSALLRRIVVARYGVAD